MVCDDLDREIRDMCEVVHFSVVCILLARGFWSAFMYRVGGKAKEEEEEKRSLYSRSVGYSIRRRLNKRAEDSWMLFTVTRGRIY